MKVLVTGFERFGKYSTNPSKKLATELNGRTIEGANVVGRVLPVRFGSVGQSFIQYIQREKPDIVITLGLAFRHLDSVTLETSARRVINPAFPDNEKKWPLRTDGKYELAPPLEPDKLRATLPIKRIKNALKARRIRVRISRNAGGHMCEQVMYLGRLALRDMNSDGISGHIHLPHDEEAAREVGSRDKMDFDKIRRAVEIAIEESVRHLQEARAAK